MLDIEELETAVRFRSAPFLIRDCDAIGKTCLTQNQVASGHVGSTPTNPMKLNIKENEEVISGSI